MNAGVITGVVMAASGVTVMARLRGQAGQLVTQASFSAITYQVANLTKGVIAGSGSLVIASSIYDSLQQNDPRWDVDSAGQPSARDNSYGYNFAATFPASCFPANALSPPGLTATQPNQYQIDIKFTPVSGEPFEASAVVTALSTYL